jgi:hypothetical protein
MIRGGCLVGLLSCVVLVAAARAGAEAELSLDAAVRPLVAEETRQVESELRAAVRSASGDRVELQLRYQPLVSTVAAPGARRSGGGGEVLRFDPETITRSSRAVSKRQPAGSTGTGNQSLAKGLLDEVNRLAPEQAQACPPAASGGQRPGAGVKPGSGEKGGQRLHAEPRPGVLGGAGTAAGSGRGWQGGAGASSTAGSGWGPGPGGGPAAAGAPGSGGAAGKARPKVGGTVGGATVGGSPSGPGLAPRGPGQGGSAAGKGGKR